MDSIKKPADTLLKIIAITDGVSMCVASPAVDVLTWQASSVPLNWHAFNAALQHVSLLQLWCVCVCVRVYVDMLWPSSGYAVEYADASTRYFGTRLYACGHDDS